MKEESFVVRNMTDTDINLGEIMVRVLARKTVDLMKMRPELTIEKIKRQIEVGTLGIRLKNRQLIEVAPAQSNMKVVGNATVFEEKSENITFPNRVKRGVKMENIDGLLEQEIYRDEDEEEVAIPNIQKDSAKEDSEKSIIMKIKEAQDTKEQSDVAQIKMDNGSFAVVVEDREEDLDKIKSLVGKHDVSIKNPDSVPIVADSHEGSVVSENGSFAVVAKDDVKEVTEKRPIEIKSKQGDGSAALPQTQKQKEEGIAPNDIMKDATTEPRIEGDAIVITDTKIEPEETLVEGQCLGKNRFGKQCRNRAKKDSNYCMIHKMQEDK